MKIPVIGCAKEPYGTFTDGFEFAHSDFRSNGQAVTCRRPHRKDAYHQDTARASFTTVANALHVGFPYQCQEEW